MKVEAGQLIEFTGWVTDRHNGAYVITEVTECETDPYDESGMRELERVVVAEMAKP